MCRRLRILPSMRAVQRLGIALSIALAAAGFARLARSNLDAASDSAGVIAAGGGHSCAVTPGRPPYMLGAKTTTVSWALTATGVKCWGLNLDGRLGDGTTTSRTQPADVSGLAAGIVAVAAGAEHTCALTAAGGVKCWGYNAFGQLGDGTTTSRSTPAIVGSPASNTPRQRRR